jgi:hypothetical protein
MTVDPDGARSRPGSRHQVPADLGVANPSRIAVSQCGWSGGRLTSGGARGSNASAQDDSAAANACSSLPGSSEIVGVWGVSDGTPPASLASSSPVTAATPSPDVTRRSRARCAGLQVAMGSWSGGSSSRSSSAGRIGSTSRSSSERAVQAEGRDREVASEGWLEQGAELQPARARLLLLSSPPQAVL